MILSFVSRSFDHRVGHVDYSWNHRICRNATSIDKAVAIGAALNFSSTQRDGANGAKPRPRNPDGSRLRQCATPAGRTQDPPRGSKTPAATSPGLPTRHATLPPEPRTAHRSHIATSGRQTRHRPAKRPGGETGGEGGRNAPYVRALTPGDGCPSISGTARNAGRFAASRRHE